MNNDSEQRIVSRKVRLSKIAKSEKRENNKVRRWKIAFFCVLTILFLVAGCSFYKILDQAISLDYMQQGYSWTEHDLEQIIEIINETDLTKSQIKNALGDHMFYQFMDFDSDTVELERVQLIFDDNRLKTISDRW
mgnify:FL=1